MFYLAVMRFKKNLQFHNDVNYMRKICRKKLKTLNKFFIAI